MTKLSGRPSTTEAVTVVSSVLGKQFSNRVARLASLICALTWMMQASTAGLVKQRSAGAGRAAGRAGTCAWLRVASVTPAAVRPASRWRRLSMSSPLSKCAAAVGKSGCKTRVVYLRALGWAACLGMGILPLRLRRHQGKKNGRPGDIGPARFGSGIGVRLLNSDFRAALERAIYARFDRR